MDLQLTGARVLVTGGTRGIGRAIVPTFLDEGAVVAFCARNPEEISATEEALRGGWLRTGDLATVDAEGYVVIIDRRKDVIVSGGENIASIEVETALCAHPAVLEASVVAMPDDRWGEVPRAFVVLRPGAMPTEEELIEAVRSRLARFKAPRVVEFVEDLPRNSTGKVLKSDLRARPLAG